MGLLDKFGGLFKNEKRKSPNGLEKYLELVKKEPENAKAHLKLAELYQKREEKQKSIVEYLRAADIYSQKTYFAQAMAVYKQVLKQDPSLERVHLRIAEVYREMGFLADAFAQYKILAHYYDSLGMKDKALEVMVFMAELDPRKITLKEKIQRFQHTMKFEGGEGRSTGPREVSRGKIAGRGIEEDFFDLGAELEAGKPLERKDWKEISSLEKDFGFEDIFKELKSISGPSAVDPNFNFNMGVACREMGLIDEAIEQFQIALERGQSPFEAANLLGLCFKEKGMLNEARQSFERALGVEGTPKEKTLEVKYELGLLYKKSGRTEEAFQLLKKASTAVPGDQETKDRSAGLAGGLKTRDESLT